MAVGVGKAAALQLATPKELGQSETITPPVKFHKEGVGKASAKQNRSHA